MVTYLQNAYDEKICKKVLIDGLEYYEVDLDGFDGSNQ